MLYKKNVFILSCALVFSTAFSMAAKLSDAEKVFYKDHKDAFAQKVFVDDPERVLWSSGKLFLSAASFFIPAALSIMVTEASRQGHSISISDRNHQIESSTIGTIVGLFFLWSYRKYANYAVNKDMVAKFFREYEGDNGLKTYLPQSLVATSDAMFQEYLENGDSYFVSDEFNNLLKAVQDEIVKNNPAKFDKKINKTLIIAVCFTAIVLVLTNAFMLNKVQKGLHFLREDVDYWGARAEIRRPVNQQ